MKMLVELANCVALFRCKQDAVVRFRRGVTPRKQRPTRSGCVHRVYAKGLRDAVGRCPSCLSRRRGDLRIHRPNWLLHGKRPPKFNLAAPTEGT